MVNVLYALLAVFVLGISLLTTFRTEAMLDFRSPGTIEPGSVPGWKLWVWRGLGATMAVTSLAVLYISVVEL
jgi:hypothetical protein